MTVGGNGTAAGVVVEIIPAVSGAEKGGAVAALSLRRRERLSEVSLPVTL
jgi:hypothetical protein